MAQAQCLDFLGFTAATGSNSEEHDILSWSVAGTAINYPDFSSTSGLNLIGSAVQSGTVLRLTPDSLGQDGAAWFAVQQAVLGGFDTTFQFKIPSDNSQADGFAFVVQNSPARGFALGGGGGGIGFEGIPNSLAVEFDTFQNTGFDDPECPHVSVMTRGAQPNSPDHLVADLGTPFCYGAMVDGSAHTVRILYVPGTLSVFLDGATSASVTVPVDLSILSGPGCTSQAPAMSAGGYLILVAALVLLGTFALSRTHRTN